MEEQVSSNSKVADSISALLSDIGLEGLTATTLQDGLAKLDIRREELLMTLYAAASETYTSRTQEASNNQLGDEALATDLDISTALAALREQGLIDDESSLRLAELATQDAALCSALQQSRQQAAGVRLAAELQHRLAEFDSHVQSGAFSEAAWIAIELQKVAAAGHNAVDEASDAQITARIEPLRQHLITVAPQYLEVDPATHVPSLHRPAGQTGAALQEILKAAEILGILSEVLNSLSAFFMNYSVLPILYAEQQHYEQQQQRQGMLLGGGSGSQYYPQASPATSIASSALSAATTMGDGRVATERLLYKSFKVLCDQVLHANPDTITCMGQIFWPAASKAYITLKLKPVRPQTDAELEGFSRCGALGQKLEQKAVKLGLLSSESDGPIARYVRQAVGRVLNTRRARFVAAARDLMVSSAAHETVTLSSGVPRRVGASRALFDDDTAQQLAAAAQHEQHDKSHASTPLSSLSVLQGEPPLLDTGSCLVSKSIEGVVAAMQEALADALRSGSPVLGQAMCAAVVDMAAVTVAVPPSLTPEQAQHAQQQQQQQHQHQVESEALLLPYPASVRYNDLYYIYTTLCMLPYLFSPRLQQLVHPNVNFISAATRVKQAADDVMGAMLEHQLSELLAISSQFHRLRGSMDGHGVNECKRAVMQLLHAFRRLGSVLRGVLTPMKLTEVAGVLMEAIAKDACDVILSMPDISMDESEQIPRILGELTAGLYDTVLSGLATNTSNTLSNSEHITAKVTLVEGGATAGVGQSAGTSESIPQRCRQLLHNCTPSVSKLSQVLWILEARMQGIIDRWREGQLSAAGLSAEELASLVRALFEDTDKRRDVLRELKEGKPPSKDNGIDNHSYNDNVTISGIQSQVSKLAGAVSKLQMPGKSMQKQQHQQNSGARPIMKEGSSIAAQKQKQGHTASLFPRPPQQQQEQEQVRVASSVQFKSETSVGPTSGNSGGGGADDDWNQDW